MDTRVVAAILAVLVILAGFLVVRSLIDGANSVPDTADDFECRVNGGTCADTCSGEELDFTCGGERVCCDADR